MQRLGNLFHNYGGLNNIKDEFAQMLYAQSSSLFLSKNGSEILEDTVRLNRQKQNKLKESLNNQMLDMVTNSELAARQEKISLEVFTVENHLKQIIDPFTIN